MQEATTRASVHEAVARSRACFAEQSSKWAADETQARVARDSLRKYAAPNALPRRRDTSRRSERATLPWSSPWKRVLPPPAQS